MLLLPEVLAIAGPNGSGKSTVTSLARTPGIYLNADDIKRSLQCTDIEAAQHAEKLREQCLSQRQDFTFETVLSTPRNLNLLKRAHEAGYFVRCLYILTSDPLINISRVKSRELSGGHGVPEEKIVSRYYRAKELLPQVIETCDIVNIYDNSGNIPCRIFKKRKHLYFAKECQCWSIEEIKTLTGIEDFLPFPAK